MPYASITIAETLTLADYDAVGQQLGSEPVDGLRSEAAGCGDGGLHVITLWDSKTHHERFIGERLVPAFERMGLQPGPMTFTGLEVHALYVRPEPTPVA